MGWPPDQIDRPVVGVLVAPTAPDGEPIKHGDGSSPPLPGDLRDQAAGLT